MTLAPLVSAVPIEFERKLDQYSWPSLTAIPVGLLAPSMKSPLAPDPSRLACPICPLRRLVQ